jgi:hypothetical protein
MVGGTPSFKELWIIYLPTCVARFLDNCGKYLGAPQGCHLLVTDWQNPEDRNPSRNREVPSDMQAEAKEREQSSSRDDRENSHWSTHLLPNSLSTEPSCAC